MVADQILGRFGWYRRHRGGFWTRIPGAGYFHRRSTRDDRPEWKVALDSVRSRYGFAWLGRFATKAGDRDTQS